MKKAETKFKEKVLRDLASLGNAWVTKIQQVGIRGTPDILACIAGFFVAIELKKDGKSKEDPLQLYNIHAIKKAGGIAVVVYPDTWAGVYKDLQSISLQMEEDHIKYLS